MIAEAVMQNRGFHHRVHRNHRGHKEERIRMVVLRGIDRSGPRRESGGPSRLRVNKTAALQIGGAMKVAGMAVIAATLGGAGVPAIAQQRTPLLAEKEVAALANELSGETAKRNLEGLARLHRQRGSAGFHAAAELVAERARAYGLSDVAILQFPADGKVFYGTQRSRPGWDAEVGELEEVKEQSPETPVKIASYRAMPIVLAEDSE